MKPPRTISKRLKEISPHLLCMQRRDTGEWEFLWDRGKAIVENYPNSRYIPIMKCMTPDNTIAVSPMHYHIDQMLYFLDLHKKSGKEMDDEHLEDKRKIEAARARKIRNDAEARGGDLDHIMAVEMGDRHKFVRGQELS